MQVEAIFFNNAIRLIKKAWIIKPKSWFLYCRKKVRLLSIKTSLCQLSMIRFQENILCNHSLWNQYNGVLRCFITDPVSQQTSLVWYLLTQMTYGFLVMILENLSALQRRNHVIWSTSNPLTESWSGATHENIFQKLINKAKTSRLVFVWWSRRRSLSFSSRVALPVSCSPYRVHAAARLAVAQAHLS